MAYTTDDIITWGKISQPLSARGEALAKATKGSSVDQDHHIKLYIERKTVEWYNSQADPDADILYTISNFLFALEGIWGLRAQYIDTGSGGQVAPVSPTDLSGALNPYDWIVSATTASYAPMKDGDTTVLLDGTNGTQNFRGFNIEFYRGGQPQYTTNPGDGSTYYTWNRATGRLTVSTAVYTGEPLRIAPIQALVPESATTSSQSQPLSFLVGSTAGAPTAGTDTWTLPAFENRYVVLFLGGQIVNQSDMGDGAPYITKTLADNFLTINNYVWQDGDILLYELE